MKIKIDRRAVRRFVQIGAVEDRRYYVTQASDPKLAIVVCRDETDLPSLVNQVVDASIGWDAGTLGFVLAGEVGRRHTKVTIYRRLRWRRSDTTLSKVLAEAPER